MQLFSLSRPYRGVLCALFDNAVVSPESYWRKELLSRMRSGLISQCTLHTRRAPPLFLLVLVATRPGWLCEAQ